MRVKVELDESRWKPTQTRGWQPVGMVLWSLLYIPGLPFRSARRAVQCRDAQPCQVWRLQDMMLRELSCRENCKYMTLELALLWLSLDTGEELPAYVVLFRLPFGCFSLSEPLPAKPESSLKDDCRDRAEESGLMLEGLLKGGSSLFSGSVESAIASADTGKASVYVDGEIMSGAGFDYLAALSSKVMHSTKDCVVVLCRVQASVVSTTKRRRGGEQQLSVNTGLQHSATRARHNARDGDAGQVEDAVWPLYDCWREASSRA